MFNLQCSIFNVQSSMFNVQCNTIMKPEKKKELFKFLWKLLTAFIAALTTAIGVSACCN